jgi:tRNA(adenine34) deaminase
MKNVAYHAEMIAISDASKKMDNWRLNGCSMYVTLEPCPMCAGAIIQSRIDKIYIGTFNPTCGACGSVINFSSK